MSTAEIKIMFHFYTCHGPLFLCDKCFHGDSKGDQGNTAIILLAGKGLLKLPTEPLKAGEDKGTFRLTDKGLAYIKALIAMPLPETFYRVRFTFDDGPEYIEEHCVGKR